jgi:hypothetical protein
VAAEGEGLGAERVCAGWCNGGVRGRVEVFERGFQAADDVGEGRGGGEPRGGRDAGGEVGELLLGRRLEEPEGELRIGDVVCRGDGGKGLEAGGDLGKKGVGERVEVGEGGGVDVGCRMWDVGCGRRRRGRWASGRGGIGSAGVRRLKWAGGEPGGDGIDDGHDR